MGHITRALGIIFATAGTSGDLTLSVPESYHFGITGMRKQNGPRSACSLTNISIRDYMFAYLSNYLLISGIEPNHSGIKEPNHSGIIGVCK